MKDYHVLVIHTQAKLAYIIEARTCSIGRHNKNAIVLDQSSISRQHAMLLRLPGKEGSYSYRLVDGNSDGAPSKNGTYINGKRCSIQDLQSGDMITFGADIRATYMVVPKTQINLKVYLKAEQLHSIKDNFSDATMTMVKEDLTDEDLTRLLSLSQR